MFKREYFQVSNGVIFSCEIQLRLFGASVNLKSCFLEINYHKIHTEIETLLSIRIDWRHKTKTFKFNQELHEPKC